MLNIDKEKVVAMKLLVVGGLLTVGIVVVGSLTMGLMQENDTEQSEVVQSTNDLVLQESPIANVIDDSIVTVSLYGNENQPGHRVHQAINDLVLQGTPVKASILNVIDNVIANEGASLISSTALNSTKNHRQTALAFMSNMVAANNLFPATKLSIENKPEDVTNIVNIAVLYYPDFAQEVINAAVITGEIAPNDALLAAIAAGADPTTVSEATAAGGSVAGAAGGNITEAGLPLNGLGGGGTGNEDPSASNN